MEELGSTTESRVFEKESEFVTVFLVMNSTLRDKILEIVFTLQAVIKEKECKDHGDRKT